MFVDQVNVCTHCVYICVVCLSQDVFVLRNKVYVCTHYMFRAVLCVCHKMCLSYIRNKSMYAHTMCSHQYCVFVVITSAHIKILLFNMNMKVMFQEVKL